MTDVKLWLAALATAFSCSQNPVLEKEPLLPEEAASESCYAAQEPEESAVPEEPARKQLAALVSEAMEYYSSNKAPEVRYGKKVPEGEAIKSVQDALKFHHYLCTEATGVLDEATAEAIELYRRKNALNGEGIDALLAKRLSASSGKRVKLLKEAKAAMDSVYDEKPHIYVNLPEFRLRLYDKGILEFGMDVVIGKKTDKGKRSSKWHTDVQHGYISKAIVNPWWYVPKGEITKEIKAKLKKDAALKQEMEQFVKGKWQIVGGNKVKGVKFRQRPGSVNPLGRIAYPLNTPTGELLHGTPGKDLFSKNIRTYSHGCMRLQDEGGFFEKLQQLGLVPSVDVESMIAEQSSSLPKTQNVSFLESIAVDVVYVRAWVEEGQCGAYMTMPPDVYGYGKSVVK